MIPITKQNSAFWDWEMWKKPPLRLIAILVACGAIALLTFLWWQTTELQKEINKVASEDLKKEKMRKNRQDMGAHPLGVAADCALPCVYPEVVDFRIIILTYNRPQSLMKCLESVSKLELNGSRAAMEVWIDRSENGSYDKPTLEAAKSFTWTKGIYRVHIHKHHAGLYGQWIETWRPPDHQRELGLILEDDTDISRWSYRWLRAAYNYYNSRFPFCGISLDSHHSPTVTSKFGPMEMPANQTVFLFRHHHNWGLSPHPKYWRLFQDWNYQARKDSLFHPYVEEDGVWNTWYKDHEKRHIQHKMWEMWYSHFTTRSKIWCILANHKTYFQNHLNYKHTNVSFAYNRKEPGLHYSKPKVGTTTEQLINQWEDFYLNFPKQPLKYGFNGKEFSGHL